MACAGHATSAQGQDWAAGAFGRQAAQFGQSAYVRAEDLLALREIDGLSVSPDGKQVAFPVHQAIPSENEYRLVWFIAPTDGSSPPRALPFDGGRPIPAFTTTGLSGWFPENDPKWSPDGSSIAVRRRDGERIGLAVIDVQSGRSRPVADGESQVTDFAWAPSGTLVFRTGYNAVRQAEAVAIEARHGWLLDDRMPLSAARTPSPRTPDCVGVSAVFGAGASRSPVCDRQTLAFDIDSTPRPATPSEVEALDQASRPSGRLPKDTKGTGLVAGAADGLKLAWTASFDGWEPTSSEPLRRVVAAAPRQVVCPDAGCQSQRFRGLGWARNGASIWFVKQSSSVSEERGPFDEDSIYEWRLDTGAVRRVSRSTAIFEHCEAFDRLLYCRRSSATQPGTLVSIDLDNGRERIIADPNRPLTQKAFPRIEQIPIADKEGNPGFARLVYPVGYRSGQRYPLVVVLYTSRGFLRGGVGNEYPIFPLSSAGYFVMSVQYPRDNRVARDVNTWEAQREKRRDKQETSSTVFAIEEAIKRLDLDGKVDPQRVAITGLSYGSDVVHTALQRSTVFSLAIASSMQGDITTNALMPEGATGKRQLMYIEGETSPLATPGGSILAGAWSARPDRLRAPLLINAPQSEAMVGFEGIAMLKAAGRPIEVRVFPDEGHVKYFPQSYTGVYDNNLMWLNFWLKGEEDARPEFAAQYVRWRAMRDRLAAEKAQPR